MFWDKWIPAKFHIKSEICGLEICFNENSVNYHYTCLKSKKNKLEVAQTGTSLDKLELPQRILKDKIPLFIVLNGKGIILKKINLPENHENLEEIFRQNMPAINADDFYVQLYAQKDNSAYIALCRKSLLDVILLEIKNKNYDLAGVLLGAPAVIGLEPLWGNHNLIHSSQHNIELTNGVLDTITSQPDPLPEPVKIEDLSFAPQYTLGFSCGLAYLMKRSVATSLGNILPSIIIVHEQKNKFRFLMICAISTAFILAVVNVFFYTSYFDKNNKLETELGVYQGKYEQINGLLNDYQKNKDLIENAGVLNRNRLSEYGDKIAKTIPDEVVLSELYFNPKKDTDESEDSLITFENKGLILRGHCAKSFIVNEWLNVLKMQKFIRDASLERFTYNREGILPNFEIRLVTE
jgi:hypothetical protein